MSKIILTVGLIFTMCISLQAQSGGGFGIKGGLNYNSNGDFFNSISENFENPGNNVGYHLGIFGKIGNRIYLRPELIYTKTKSDFNSGDFGWWFRYYFKFRAGEFVCE